MATFHFDHKPQVAISWPPTVMLKIQFIYFHMICKLKLNLADSSKLQSISVTSSGSANEYSAEVFSELIL